MPVTAVVLCAEALPTKLTADAPALLNVDCDPTVETKATEAAPEADRSPSASLAPCSASDVVPAMAKAAVESCGTNAAVAVPETDRTPVASACAVRLVALAPLALTVACTWARPTSETVAVVLTLAVLSAVLLPWKDAVVVPGIAVVADATRCPTAENADVPLTVVVAGTNARPTIATVDAPEADVDACAVDAPVKAMTADAARASTAWATRRPTNEGVVLPEIAVVA